METFQLRKIGRRAGWALLAIGLFGCATAEAPKQVELTWPLPPEQPRIKFLKSVVSSEDVEQRSGAERLKEVLLGINERRSKGMKKPYGVHADREGRLFVADTGWGKVLVFDFTNNKFSFWGEHGKGFLVKPVGVTSDSQGRVYVTDVEQNRAVVYDREGHFLYAVGKKGELAQPVGIAVNEKLGQIYIVDAKKHHIAVFDMEGRVVSTIGERGTEPGQFNFPTNLAIDQEGKLYVMDSMNFRVQVLDSDGKVLKTFGRIGDSLGQFARPKGIAVDSEGHIYVVDAAFNNFQIFDQEGTLLLFVGSLGHKRGQFWLPAGIYVDAEDRIYVADQYNFRVQVFQHLREEGPRNGSAGAEPKRAQQAENKRGDQRGEQTESMVTAERS